MEGENDSRVLQQAIGVSGSVYFMCNGNFLFLLLSVEMLLCCHASSNIYFQRSTDVVLMLSVESSN